MALLNPHQTCPTITSPAAQMLVCFCTSHSERIYACLHVPHPCQSFHTVALYPVGHWSEERVSPCHCLIVARRLDGPFSPASVLNFVAFSYPPRFWSRKLCSEIRAVLPCRESERQREKLPACTQVSSFGFLRSPSHFFSFPFPSLIILRMPYVPLCYLPPSAFPSYQPVAA